MSTLLKPLQVREKLLSQKIKVFNSQLFSQIFNSSKFTTKHFLEIQVKTGLLTRLKRGLYALKTDLPSEEEIANQLYHPSYISFEYALAFYGLLPEMPYIITSATTKPTRNFTINSSTYSYRTIKKNLFTGYSLIKQGNRSFFMADPEKAFLDYSYFVFLHKSPQNDRLITQSTLKIDRKKVEYYLSLSNNSAFTKYANTIL